MKNKKRRTLFKSLRTEAEQMGLEQQVFTFIAQLQTAFDCAETVYDKVLCKQSRKIDSLVAKLNKFMPDSNFLKKIEAERRMVQHEKDFKPDDRDDIIFDSVDLNLMCKEDY